MAAESRRAGSALVEVPPRASLLLRTRKRHSPNPAAVTASSLHDPPEKADRSSSTADCGRTFPERFLSQDSSVGNARQTCGCHQHSASQHRCAAWRLVRGRRRKRGEEEQQTHTKNAHLLRVTRAQTVAVLHQQSDGRCRAQRSLPRAALAVQRFRHPRLSCTYTPSR